MKTSPDRWDSAAVMSSEDIKLFKSRIITEMTWFVAVSISIYRTVQLWWPQWPDNAVSKSHKQCRCNFLHADECHPAWCLWWADTEMIWRLQYYLYNIVHSELMRRIFGALHKNAEAWILFTQPPPPKRRFFSVCPLSPKSFYISLNRTCTVCDLTHFWQFFCIFLVTFALWERDKEDNCVDQCSRIHITY